MVQVLLDERADPNCSSVYEVGPAWGMYIYTPLGTALSSRTTLPILVALLEAGADPEAEFIYNFKRLKPAALGGRQELLGEALQLMSEVRGTPSFSLWLCFTPLLLFFSILSFGSFAPSRTFLKREARCKRAVTAFVGLRYFRLSHLMVLVPKVIAFFVGGCGCWQWMLDGLLFQRGSVCMVCV